jgi:hypothetical protein
MLQSSITSVSPHLPQTHVGGSAVLSDCGKYRYELSRTWDELKPKVMFLMLNPSTADANKDDATIRRCIGFAKSWGFGGLYVCNIFAFRATNPKELLKIDNPFGDKNIWHTRQICNKVESVICAWGNESIVRKLLKNDSPFKMFDYIMSKLHYLELSKSGVPKHPLYLKSELKPVKYELAVCP